MTLYSSVKYISTKNLLTYKNNFLQIKDQRYFRNTAMKPILYYDEVSPPARFVLMTAKHLNIGLEMRRIDLFKNENRSDIYRKINPMCKVPAMCVNDNTIIDSHAICLYLCKMYDDGTLYPKDEVVQARVHEMLFYNSSTLFPIDSAVFTEYFAGKKTVDDKYLKLWSTAVDFLELRLQNSAWLSDKNITLSDLCCAATISSLQILVPPEEKHQRVKNWLQKISQQSFYDINEKGLQRLQEFVKKMNRA